MTLWSKLRMLRPSIRRAAERDIQDELATLRELAGSGELGNLTLAAEDRRAGWTWRWLEEASQHVRYAWRSMRQARTFTAIAVLSLALGIGANTAICSCSRDPATRSLLFGITGTDPTVMMSGLAVLLVCGLRAGDLPARRALAIDPIAALRSE